MKKTVCVLSVIIMIISCISMNGCSDFSFNPLGTWEMYSQSVYDKDGKEIFHAGEADFPANTEYTFEKSGTGYITVNGRKSIIFTYTYDSEAVTVEITRKDNPTLDLNEVTKNVFVVKSDGATMVWSKEEKTELINGTGVLTSTTIKRKGTIKEESK